MTPRLCLLAASLTLGLALAPPLAMGVTLTALEKIDTVVGKGSEVVVGSTVTMHYTGWLYAPSAPKQHGSRFDSSRDSQPLSFKVGTGTVIKGWDDGVRGMRVGGKRTLVVPASMGFGKDGLGPVPSKANLIFDVEVLDVK